MKRLTLALQLMAFTDFGNANISNVSFENPAGYLPVGYIALVDDIDTFPTLSTNPQNDVEATTLNGNFTMKANKFFQQIYSSPKKTSATHEGGGDADTSGVEAKPKFFIPGLSVETKALARRIRSGKLVAIFATQDGKRLVYGNENYPATCSNFTEMTGESIQDARGTEFELSFESLVVPFYNGPIPLNGNTIPQISS